MTIAESAVQNALYELWYDYYAQSITQKERNQLARDFTEQWLDPSKVKVDKPAYYHPMTRLKQRFDRPPVTALEILADFVIRADIHAERGVEYPVTHEEQEITLEDRRRTNEVGLFSDEVDYEEGERVPYGYISEADAIAQLYTPTKPISADDFKIELSRVKKYAAFYATSFAEEYGYDRKETLKRINALDLERVRECKVCGGAFYPKDLRRFVCDQQHGLMVGGGRSEKSACELIDEANYQREYYKKNAI